MDPADLLNRVNERHNTSFQLRGSLSGGYQEGSYEIVDLSGISYVLKQTATPRSLPIIEQLRGRGYRTPEFLLTGTTPEGTPYLIQEFAEGQPIERLTPGFVVQLLAQNRLQADLYEGETRPNGNWSDYAYNVVFHNESGWAECLRTYSPETSRLMERLAEAAERYRSTPIPCTDAVHGDWSYGNLLTEDDRITAIVDCAYAGYGTRAIDLASLLHYAYHNEDSGEITEPLRNEILSIGGVPLLTVLLIYRIMALVEFSVHHHGDDAVMAFVRSGEKIVEALSALTYSSD
ncbi:MAG: aminoglycoside phosphotransferase family protein [Armatimonas sp.]